MFKKPLLIAAIAAATAASVTISTAAASYRATKATLCDLLLVDGEITVITSPATT